MVDQTKDKWQPTSVFICIRFLMPVTHMNDILGMTAAKWTVISGYSGFIRDTCRKHMFQELFYNTPGRLPRKTMLVVAKLALVWKPRFFQKCVLAKTFRCHARVFGSTFFFLTIRSNWPHLSKIDIYYDIFEIFSYSNIMHATFSHKSNYGVYKHYHYIHFW